MALPETTNTVDNLNREAWEQMIARPKDSLSLAERAYRDAAAIAYTKGKADAALNIGWCSIYLSKTEQAIKYLEEAFTFYSNLDESVGAMKSLNALGVVYHDMSKYERALEYYTKSLNLSMASGNKERELAATNNIGELYQELNNREEALDYFNRAVALAEDVEDREKRANVLVNLGLINHLLGENTKALTYLEEALSDAESIEDKISLAKCYTVLGVILGQTGKREKACEMHQRSIDISRQTENKHGEMEAVYNLALLYAEEENYEQSKALLTQTLALGKDTGSQHFLYKSYFQLSLLYEKQRDYEAALEQYKKYNEIEKGVHESEINQLKNIELKRKTEQLETVLERMKLVREIGQKITASLDINTIMFTVYDHVRLLTNSDSFGIALYHKESEEIEYKLFIEETRRLPSETKKLEPDKNFASWCIANRKEILINDNEREYTNYLKQPPPTTGKRGHSIIYIPLMIEEEVIGVLSVQSTKKNAFSVDQLDLLKTLGSYLAIALENSIIHERLRKINILLGKEKQDLQTANQQISYMANHDNLTGLPNRRLLYELVSQALPFAERNGEVIGIFYIDLDNFKPINDNYGHDVGDGVLRAVAERILNSLRSSDTVARFGGDEFIAVLRNASEKEGIRHVAAKMLENLALPVTVLEESYAITASIGISLYPSDGTTFEELLRKADDAMYRIKETGKKSFLFADEAGQ